MHKPFVVASAPQEALCRLPAPIAASLWPLHHPNTHLWVGVKFQPRFPKLSVHCEQGLQVLLVLGVVVQVFSLPRATPSTRRAAPKNNLHSPAPRNIHG